MRLTLGINIKDTGGERASLEGRALGLEMKRGRCASFDVWHRVRKSYVVTEGEGELKAHRHKGGGPEISLYSYVFSNWLEKRGLIKMKRAQTNKRREGEGKSMTGLPWDHRSEQIAIGRGGRIRLRKLT